MSYYDYVYRDYELPSRASNVYRYLCDRANAGRPSVQLRWI